MASSSKKKKIQEMERQDDQGISRKKWKFTINPNVFLLIKFLLVILIPVVYFVYSPLLILVMLGFIGTFFLAKMAEHSLNKSVIRSNHIHIVKFDSAIALLVVVISIAGSLLSLNNKSKTSSFEEFGDFGNFEISANIDNSKFKGMQKQMKNMKIKQYFANLGSLLTGERNVFLSKKSFGTVSKPSNFKFDDSQFDGEKPDFDGESPDFDPSSMDFSGGDMPDFDNFKGMMKSDIKFSFDDLPISYVSSSTLSTVNTVLIFAVSFFGFISIILIYIKKRKFEKTMNEIIVEGKIELLDEKELERILSFGEEIEEVKISKKEENKKIAEQENLDEIKLEQEKQETQNNEDLEDKIL